MKFTQYLFKMAGQVSKTLSLLSKALSLLYKLLSLLSKTFFILSKTISFLFKSSECEEKVLFKLLIFSHVFLAIFFLVGIVIHGFHIPL